MSAARWINETLYEAWSQRFRIRRELIHVRSNFQDILIFESETYGRVMMLDGIVQITERDEFIYQEMMVHVPLLSHGSAKNVLIIGAGDGGVLRRVLQHKAISRVVMVEIDGEVIRLAKEFLPTIAGDAWNDPRAEVIVGDGIDYVIGSPAGAFDIIIVDSTDPVGVGEILFTDRFYEHSAHVLTSDGIIVNQCGVPFMQADELRITNQRREKFFPQVSVYVAAVPTYVGGLMAFGIGRKSAASITADASIIRDRALAAGILGSTRYWTPEIHAGSFNLPPYISDQIAIKERSEFVDYGQSLE